MQVDRIIWRARASFHFAAMASVLALASGCGRADDAPPPPRLSFQGLPVTGDLDLARQAGFTSCLEYNIYFRCRREGVMFEGVGPFHAAVDARGTDGASGFREVSLWSVENQHILPRLARRLVSEGWSECRTGEEDRGDQHILTKAGSPVRLSIDITYWGNRRLRILPEAGQETGKCW